MTLDYKVLSKVKGNPSAEVAPGRRLKLNPGQDYLYDMPKELISEMADKFSLNDLLDTDAASLSPKGREFMQCLIELADSDRFRDRTADMIELVAQQTGIRFPHCFERYVELFILTLRPRDAWTVTAATTKRLTVRSYNCSLAAGFSAKGTTACEGFCLSAAQAAAEKAGVVLEMSRSTAPAGLCQLNFSPRKEG